MVNNMNMMVINKNNNKEYEVFDITYDNNGYPRFLIYNDGQWLRMSAKNFRPIKENVRTRSEILDEFEVEF